jgi:hypothetical protein
MNIYTLSEELKVSPQALRDWLRAGGLSKNDKVSPRAATLARQHFVVMRAGEGATGAVHPLAQLFAQEDERARAARESAQEPQGLRAPAREHRRPVWGKSEQLGPSIASLSPDEQRRLLREMRQQEPPPRAHPSPPASPPAPPPASPPAPPPAPPPASPPASPKPTAPQSFSETYYKRQYEDLLSAFQAQKDRLKTLEIDNKTLKSELEKTEARRPATGSSATGSSATGSGATPQEAAPQPSAIWEELSAFGLIERDALYALFEALNHPVRGPELLYRLKLDDASLLLRGFSLICRDELCEEVASPRAPMGLIEVSAEQCVVCGGNDNRRWYKRLVMEWRARGGQATPWLLVGGEEANYEALKQQARECPGPAWMFAPGNQSSTLASANAAVGQVAGVLIWGGMALPHSMSGQYKAAAAALNRPCLTIPPGNRSVSSICKALLRHWGVEVVL